MEKGEHRIVSTLEKVLRPYEPTMWEENIGLVNRFQKPALATYDEEKISHVMKKLVEHAIDHTKDQITVGVDGDEEKVWFSIRDNGRKIPQEKQEEMFEGSYQKKKGPEDQRFDDTGVGLGICKRIVEAHGGEIRFNSELNEGTTFTVFLPR